MNKLQTKSIAGLLALVCILFATAPHSAESSEPKAPLPSEKRHFISGPSPEDIRNLVGIQEIIIGLKARNANNPKPLTREWQKRIVEAAGVPLEYVRVVVARHMCSSYHDL